MKLEPGVVILLKIDFHQAEGSKVRPAVVLFDSGDDDFMAAPITSRRREIEYDLESRSWRAAGLNVPSFIRVHKLTVLAKSAVRRNLNRLADSDCQALRRVLARMFFPAGA